jgi:hypothetical protein
MKWHVAKICVATLLLAGLAGCGGGKGGSGSGSTTSIVSGTAQGPLVSGTVTVQDMDATLTPVSGVQPTYAINSALGTFAASAVTSANISLSATGKYFDEVYATSAGTLTLDSYASSSDAAWNVNILTTLAYRRIKSLVGGGMTFQAARLQAEKEVLAAFYIRDQNTYTFGTLDLSTWPAVRDEDHILAAIASVFEYGGTGNSTGLVSNLISSFQNELASNSGMITTTANVDALKNNSIGINAATVAANLTTEYSTAGTLFYPTDISDWLDQDGDHVIGKFKFNAAQAAVGTAYQFPSYTVGASDSGATYSFASYSGNPNNPNTVNPIANSTCKFSGTGSTVASAVVATGDAIIVSCTPAAHEASSTYLQSVPSVTPVPTGMSLPIYIARYDFTPFATEASLKFARSYATATVLETPGGPLNGQVLVAGGEVAGTFSNTAELYDPAANTWTSTGSMNIARMGHTATMLGNGTVLVVGGDAPGKAGTAEVYNPATGTWAKIASPAFGHIHHTATLLSNGQVLVAGGILYPSSTTTSVELYNPSTGAWSTPAQMSTPARYYHTATLLQDGTVLIAGGFNGNTAISDCEIFNPATGIWALAGTGLATASYSHSATLLQNGTVLIAGGLTAAGTATTARSELFDPGDIGMSATPGWSAAAPLNTARVRHIAQLLSDGSVLIAGGSANNNSGTLASAERYQSGAWSANGNMAYARDEFSAAMLNTNLVLLVGGAGVNAAETFK